MTKAPKSPSRAKKPVSKPSEKPVDLGTLPTDSPPYMLSAWVDKMQLVVRGDVPVGMIRLFMFVPPDKLGEVFRCHTSVSHLKAMAEVLCRTLDYYPIKSEAGKAEN